MNPDIILHYYATTLHLNHFEKSGKSGGYIKLPFQHRRSLVEPNLISYPELDKFKTTNLYIFKRSLNVGANYDAELVLEHISATNFGGTPVYVVFLLKKTSTAQWSAIDQILASSTNPMLSEKPCSLDLDKIAANIINAPGNNCLTNINGTVYLLANAPIYISASHNLLDLTVSDELLMGQGFTAENAIACRVASFGSSVGGILSECGSHKPITEGFKEGYDYEVKDNSTGKQSKIDDGEVTFTADVGGVNMGKITKDGKDVDVPSFVSGNIDLNQMELECRPAEVDGESGIRTVLMNDTFAYNSNQQKVLFTFSSIFSMIGLIVFIGVIIVILFNSGLDKNLIQFWSRFSLLIIIFVSIILLEVPKTETFTAGFVLLIVSVMSWVVLNFYTKYNNLPFSFLTEYRKFFFDSSNFPFFIVSIILHIGILASIIITPLAPDIKKSSEKTARGFNNTFKF